jgi:hypothetical protein
MTDGDLLAQFESCTLPRAEWNHRAHVKVAFHYLRDLPFERALDRMRRGIIAYNAAKGLLDPPKKVVPGAMPGAGPISGYHETITQAFLRLIAAAMRSDDARSWMNADAFCDAHPELLDKRTIERHYSPTLLSTLQAKDGFVVPDLAPLP